MCSCLDGWAGQYCDEERDAECEEFEPYKNGANCTVSLTNMVHALLPHD